MFNITVLRRDKVKELHLYRNIEGVYFISQYGTNIFNDLNYDVVSDKFNSLLKENFNN